MASKPLADMPLLGSRGGYQTLAPLDRLYVRELGFRSEPIPDDLSCVASAVLACGRQFHGVSFQNCLLGVMLGNNLLPGALANAAGDVPVDVHGGFATGLGLNCGARFQAGVYPPMQAD
jgi:hypothetical protein